MSILIKGMEMPTSCERCPMLDWDLDYIKCKVTDRHFKMTECWRAIRVPDCPLVPVPPHGRLGDLDALIEKVIAKYIEHERKGEFVFAAAEIKQDIVDLISNAPTIIEAEEDET